MTKFLRVVPPLIVAVLLTAIVLPATANVPATADFSKGMLTNNTATATALGGTAINVATTDGQYVELTVIEIPGSGASVIVLTDEAGLVAIRMWTDSTPTGQPEVCLLTLNAAMNVEMCQFIVMRTDAIQRPNSDVKLGGLLTAYRTPTTGTTTWAMPAVNTATATFWTGYGNHAWRLIDATPAVLTGRTVNKPFGAGTSLRC